MAASAQSRSLTSVGRVIYRHAWWVLGFWIAVGAILNVVVPQLEQTVASRSADFLPRDLPANQSLERMAADFGVPASNAVSSVVLVDEHGIGPDDERYYHRLLARLVADKENVAYVLDTYGNPVTRDIALSPDGKAINLLVASEGSVGSTRAHHSTNGIRAHIDALPRPLSLQVHYSGPTATLADLFSAIDVSLLIITGVSILLITLLLLVAYRDLVTALVPLITIGVTLAVVRPVISALGSTGALSISNFTIAIMTALVLGAGTDYAIFTIANYHEARRRGESVGDSVARSSGRTAPILIASALTIAAACGSMIFTKIGMFTTAGPPTALAVLIALAVALTLPTALLSLAGRRGWAEPRRSTELAWRRRGARVIRHAGVYTVAALIFLVGTALIGTTFRMNWDESAMPIHDTDSTLGYDAVLEHYGHNEIAPEYLTFRADHDLRNTRDLAALEMAAMSVAGLPQVAMVRSITRPDGKPLPEAANGFQTGVVGDQLARAHRQMVTATPELQRLAAGVGQLSDGAESAATRMPELMDGTREVTTMASTVLDGLDHTERIVAIASDGRSLSEILPTVRSTLSTLTSIVSTVTAEDQARNTALRRFRATFAPLQGDRPTASCAADPTCMAARTAFDALDRAMGGRATAALAGIDSMSTASPDSVRRLTELLPELRTTLETVQSLTRQLDGRSSDQIRADLSRLTDGVSELSSGMSRLADGLRQVKAGTDTTVALTGQLTDGLRRASGYLSSMSSATRSGPGAGFYLPPEALRDPRFVEGSKLLISPDGRTARMLVTWKINPYGQEAMRASRDLPVVATRALSGTVLDGAEVSTAGLASLSADMQDQVRRDFLLFATVAVFAVLLILMVLLRSVLAPVLLVATVILSFASAVGVSVLVWQHIIGIDLDWSVIPVSFMAVIAVGADYSMLFASRIREESADRGMVRGIIRGFGSTGGVITTAGIVFALTMFALMSGTVLNLVQIGFTIAVGLLLDIAIVRTILVPAAMAVIGDRIWWPARSAPATSAPPSPDPAPTPSEDPAR
ncbi:MMPL/RND family transporter [Gordonia insulae]|uniref:Acyltrehalose exporter MmpL10 n=1 Tax=Gordonia insulae TaxID=2420509 RepID=A0A3G8JMI8_9ACTN|nr:RND family transporter [Gordonia insulae]AZG45815.1 Acyltrehalose exporter MmpL10 [Gordonia insulae]